jgi:hypothetical protein
VLEHKFASSFSADTWDVDFHLVRVVSQFRILTEPLAQLNQHLEGCLESGIDGQMLCLLLQYLIQSCAREGRRIVEDMCYEIRRAEACVD